jgi:MFS family permease
MDLVPFLRENARFLWAGVILTFTSSFGQTFFISIFAGQIMSAFALSDGQWGVTYTVGTLSSAAVLFWAGALTDRFRVRALAWVVLPALAAACLAMALNPWAGALAVCVFLLRFFGQGMTYTLAAVSMARWFVGRRGLALSVASMGIAAGQAVLPVAFAWLLGIMDWRALWGVAAATTLIAFPVILKLLAHERTPQSFAETSESHGMDGRHWTRGEVLRAPFFWLLMPLLLGPPAWGTSLFFQQVHIAEVKDWPLVSYLSLIPLMTLVAVTVTLASGQIIDRVGTARLVQVYLLPFLLGFVLLASASTLTGAAVAFLFFGIGTGLQATVITAFWAEFFGTRHIGAIKATSSSIMVVGTALGPGITGLVIDLGYTFPEQMWGIAAYFGAAMGLAVVAVSRASGRLR